MHAPLVDTCLVLMPFGPHHDPFYRELYAPVIEVVGLLPLRADEVYKHGGVMTEVCNAIADAKVIIADLTGSNPNVLYELGLAHAIRKPVIIVADRSDKLPFDIQSLRASPRRPIRFQGPEIRSRNAVE